MRSGRINYHFDYVGTCNMCGAPTKNHKVLGQRLNQSQGLRPKGKSGITTTVMQCATCGLIYSNPQPRPFSIEDHYGVSPAEYWTPGYFAHDNSYFATEISRFNELTEFKSGMTALDVGAGIGKCMLSLGQAGFDVYGFEASAPFRQAAIDKMNVNPARLAHASIENASYSPDFFDFITFGAVLEHLYEPAQSIEKAMRWLKPGGLMHIEVPSTRYLVHRFINRYYRLIGTTFVTNLSPMHAPYHLFEFSLKSFEEHASRTKMYSVRFHEYYVCSAEPFPRLLHPLVNSIMKKTNTGMQLAVWLRKNG